VIPHLNLVARMLLLKLSERRGLPMPPLLTTLLLTIGTRENKGDPVKFLLEKIGQQEKRRRVQWRNLGSVELLNQAMTKILLPKKMEAMTRAMRTKAVRGDERAKEGRKQGLTTKVKRTMDEGKVATDVRRVVRMLMSVQAMTRAMTRARMRTKAAI
jgi:hypothetical protein